MPRNNQYFDLILQEMVECEYEVPSQFPYENEHSARLLSPDAPHIRVGRTHGSGKGTVQGVKVPASIDVIWFIQKKEGKEVPVAQALRFPTRRWTEAAARKWLKDNKIKHISFEPAKKEGKNSNAGEIADITKNPFIFSMPGAVEFIAAEGQQEKTRIQLVLYDGSIVKHWFWGNLAFDLATMKMAKKRNPILFRHDEDQRIAYSDEAFFDGKFILEGPFLKNSETAKKVKSDMDDGFPFESSLKFDPDRSIIEKIGEGQSAEVNGKTLRGPGTVIRNALIMEGSICVFGALKNTVSEAFEILESKTLIEGENIMPEKLELTTELFASEYPELHSQITEAAREEGRKEVQMSFAKFAEKFKDDPSFIIEQFGKGATLAEAVEAENVKLKEAAKKPPKKPDPAEQEFSDEQTQQTASEKEKGKENKPASFDEAVKVEMKADTSSKSEIAKRAAATRLCVTKYPELHEKMLKENTRTNRE